MKKKYLLVPTLIVSTMILSGCFGGDKDADTFADKGDYEASMAYLETEIKANPKEAEDLQKQLIGVQSEYAEALIDTIIKLREQNTAISNREALKLLNKVIALNPNADENLFVEKEALEKIYFEQLALDQYAEWLNQNTVKMTEVLKLHRDNANALSEGVMNIQEFALHTTTLQKTMVVILTDAEFQLSKTTGEMTTLHTDYIGKMTTYAEVFRTMVASINQGEIVIANILKDNMIIHQIPNDYAKHVQAMHKMANEKGLFFPENIDMEAYKEITGGGEQLMEDPPKE